MSSLDKILTRLQKVKKGTGEGQFLACCPAHQDKSPSLSIKDCGDGRLLIHCFGGCATDDVLAAIGLTFFDLFPERLPDVHRPMRRAFPAADVLEALTTELRIVSICAADLRARKPLSDGDYDRLLKALDRIEDGRALANG